MSTTTTTMLCIGPSPGKIVSFPRKMSPMHAVKSFHVDMAFARTVVMQVSATGLVKSDGRGREDSMRCRLQYAGFVNVDLYASLEGANDARS